MWRPGCLWRANFVCRDNQAVCGGNKANRRTSVVYVSNIFGQANISDYLSWYREFYANGGRPTHFYDYPWQRWNFLFAKSDFRLGGECGSAARHIIVGNSSAWIGGELGHNMLY